VFQKLEFTAGSRELRTYASVKYTDSISSDVTTMTQQREVAGTLWSDTEANANTALEALIAVLFGALGTSRPTRITKTNAREGWGGPGLTATTATNSAWVQLDFQLGKTSKIAGTVGYDIIEASYTLERVGCINNTVITPTPFGRPAVQVGTGYLPGSISLNATCKAVLSSSARTWVQGKMALISAVGTDGVTRHMTAQPRESSTPEYEPFSGTTTTLFNFTGNYQWTFTGTELDNLWPISLG
jgi:hypothetical protein